MSVWETVNAKGQVHARHENGFIEFQGKFYLIGGRRVQPVDVYDPSTQKWTQASKPPMEVHHFQPIIVGNDIWIVGAMTGEFPRETPLESVLIYSPLADTWSHGPSIPEARRRGASGCAYHSDGWIYLVGGIVDGHHSGTQCWSDRLNPSSGEWERLPDAPNRRDHAPCAILNNKLYYFGGRETGRHNGQDYDAFFGHTIAAVDVYDCVEGAWFTHAQPIPIQTAAGGAAVVNNSIVYVGGEHGRPEASGDTQIFNADTNLWTSGPSLNQERHGTNCCVFNDALWIAAGSGAQRGEPELISIETINVNFADMDNAYMDKVSPSA